MPSHAFQYTNKISNNNAFEVVAMDGLNEINAFLQGFEPWQLVIGTFFLVHFVQFIIDMLISAFSK